MELSMRSRPVVAALAAILTGLTLAASAIAVSGSDAYPRMPGSSCPPHC